MIIEFSTYDVSLSDQEIKTLVDQAISYKPSSICLLPAHIKTLSNNISKDILISTVIDYPLGILDTQNRNRAVESAIKSGAQIVSVVAQPYYFCNKKYDKFREDIKSNLEICKKYSVELRYILEYRVFTYELLYKVSQILLDLGVKTIYPSTGYRLDDISDNILASALINKKVPINIICNGNIWNIGQVSSLNKGHLYGIKVNSVNALNLLSKNNQAS